VIRDTAPDPALAPTLAAPSGSVAPFLPGDELTAELRVVRLLGEGAFGWVYEASSETTGRVALKVLRPEHASNDSVVARFKRRELETLKRVHASGSHPNVVRAIEPGVSVIRGYLVLFLEYVDGPTLTEVIAKERVLDPAEAAQLILGLARGIAAIHVAGAVHRDLKPDNVRLRGGIEPVVLDLGIAKAMWETHTMTGASQALLTPFYAAPEQLSGGDITPAADVYALGLILHEMLIGNVPLAGRTFAEILSARTTRDPPDLRDSGRAIPPRLATITSRCLRRDPRQRPTALDLVEALSAPVAAARPRGRAKLYLASALVGTAAAASLYFVTRSPPGPAPVASSSPSVAPVVASVAAPVGEGSSSASVQLPPPIVEPPRPATLPGPRAGGRPPSKTQPSSVGTKVEAPPPIGRPVIKEMDHGGGR
jgi:eukaryotic-like serine/threonine-protein kinase